MGKLIVFNMHIPKAVGLGGVIITITLCNDTDSNVVIIKTRTDTLAMFLFRLEAFATFLHMLKFAISDLVQIISKRNR